MSHLHVVLISQDHELSQSVRRQFDRLATVTVLPSLRRRLPKLPAHGPHLFLVESSIATSAGLSKVLRNGHNGTSPYVIIGSPDQLVQASERLRTTVSQPSHEPQNPPSESSSDKRAHLPGLDISLGDFMERKFNEFVRKIRHSGGRNLYNILLQEFEKPLISLTLKETNGNQVQAADMLGVSRNTLRKKINKLKISVKR